MSSRRKLFLFVALPLVIIFGVMAFYHVRSPLNQASVNNGATTDTPSSDSNLVFSHQVFDPAKVSHITPLGELNGGYEEAQAIAGVMVNTKRDIISDANMLNVFAPTDMTLESYAYYDVPPDGKDWALIFRVNKDVIMRFDHITQPTEKIVAATTTTPQPTSGEVSPKKKVRVAAGEKIAQTRGTSLAKNWNIYTYDRRHTNKFVNQKRYDTGHDRSTGYKLIHSACVFSYYPEEIRATYLALMGATQAGQTNDCGNTSKDVAGTLSGMWHFDEKIGEIRQEQDGPYASPLSIYRNSANEVIIDQLGDNIRFDLLGATDPATVTASHCYPLVINERQPAGYAYFQIVSEIEMRLAYSSSGSCPTAFPATGAKTYYR